MQVPTCHVAASECGFATVSRWFWRCYLTFSPWASACWAMRRAAHLVLECPRLRLPRSSTSSTEIKAGIADPKFRVRLADLGLRRFQARLLTSESSLRKTLRNGATVIRKAKIKPD